MKKIIALFTLTLAFGITAHAQEAKKNSITSTTVQASDEAKIKIKQDAVKDVEILSKTTNLDENTKSEITNLILMRQEALEKVKSEEEKLAVFNKYTQRIKESFTADQLLALQKNKEAYLKLTTYSSK
ncbi:hypothetical protein OX283_008890 [Flavobacterium sp. SUN052]|uniref:hypothetical protein n=1 Tax=Flavobacterium sp. SUN052 TaxID=3002441 RepID=UPI00237E1B75|nr:hypothetical protein [Flavobacterium sp. SUN052]MEC4004772.1 hypothetical protein [Flavobacterium sp. SUN052]